MTTPLEQIKERLEKMKLEYNPECPFAFSDPRNDPTGTDAWNLALTEVQSLLPSIIQEVVVEEQGVLVENMLDELPEWQFKESEQIFKFISQWRIASLKEESK